MKFFFNLKGFGGAGSKGFLSELSDRAIENETDTQKERVQNKIQSSNAFTQAASHVSGLVGTTVSTLVSVAGTLGVSAALLIAVVAVVAPVVPPIVEAPVPTPLEPVLTQKEPVLPVLPEIQPPNLTPEAPETPKVTVTIPDNLPQDPILKSVITNLINTPGALEQLDNPPLTTHTSTLLAVPNDGTISNDFRNFALANMCI